MIDNSLFGHFWVLKIPHKLYNTYSKRCIAIEKSTGTSQKFLSSIIHYLFISRNWKFRASCMIGLRGSAQSWDGPILNYQLCLVELEISVLFSMAVQSRTKVLHPDVKLNSALWGSCWSYNLQTLDENSLSHPSNTVKFSEHKRSQKYTYWTF